MHFVVRGKDMWLWRAVDEHGQMLDILLQDNRDTGAAKGFFSRLIKDHTFVPQKIVANQPGSYEAAWKQLPALEKAREVRGSLEQSHRTGSRTCPREATRVSRVAIPARQTRGATAVSGFHAERVQEAAGISRGGSRSVASSISNLG
jgi:transposase-like protein